MLDPLFEWIGRMFAALLAFIAGIWRGVTWPFRAAYRGVMAARWWLKILVGLIIVPIVFFYLVFIWNALWIRNFDPNYPEQLNLSETLTTAGEQTSAEGGEQTTKSCGRSRIVDVTGYLIEFNVDTNKWISSMPLYKFGVFGVLSWDQTYFFDNKASFQRGVHQAISRTAVELTDSLARVRGTSQINPDLQAAKGNIQFDQRTWYFNPFGTQPFGPTTPTPTYFRKAVTSLQAYNTALGKCSATFDARADNLLQFMDRIAKDIGSTSALIKARAESHNSGWFDTRADDIFMYAKGQLYGYYGLMKAARVDFKDVVESRDLGDIWDRMEDHLLKAIELDPFIISNGAEDGWLMPTHLTTIGFYILRARSNLVEIRSVLDR